MHVYLKGKPHEFILILQFKFKTTEFFFYLSFSVWCPFLLSFLLRILVFKDTRIIKLEYLIITHLFYPTLYSTIDSE